MKRNNNAHFPRLKMNTAGEKNAFRLVLLTLGMTICFALVLMKLIVLQIIDHDYYAEKARRNVENRHVIQSQRGAIYDRKGRVMAKDILLYSVAVNKNRVATKKALINKLASVLEMPKSTIERKLKTNANFIYIAHKISPQKAEELNGFKNKGVILEKKFLRVYPYKVNGSHLVGFCDMDNNALGGVEYQYDKYLKGKPGWTILQRDAFGTQIPNLDYPGEEPIDGFDVRLTIDMDYQIILDEQLESAVLSSSATDGIALLMNPLSGEVLALANFPCYDPNKPNHSSSNALKNRAVSDVFEPGSTFKIVTLAAALEGLQIDIDKNIFFCENGTYRFHGQLVSDYKKFGWLTPRRIFENSSNIGTMKVAAELEKNFFYKYVRNFGFGMPSGIDLPGESAGILSPLNKFSKTTLLYMSIGYEIGATPIQLANAYAVIANRGKLFQPYLLRSVLTENQRVIYKSEPEIIRKVLSVETTNIMNDVLVGVVENGTGKATHLKGIKIAGKTGTAQLYDRVLGKYDSKKHLASFIGFFPAGNPQFVLLVIIRRPKGDYYGGLVAAPPFRKMAERIMSLAPSLNLAAVSDNSILENQETDLLPDLQDLDIEMVNNILNDLGFNGKIFGNEKTIQSETPVLQREYSPGRDPSGEKHVVTEEIIMPALTGLTLKEALNTLSDIDITASVEGYGIVISQKPQPGSKIFRDKSVRLVCRPS
jgi:cell division protein FtsI/penicillin-binding protein 2